MGFNDRTIPASDVVTAAALVAQAQLALAADRLTADTAPELKLMPATSVAIAGSAEAKSLLGGARVVAVVGSLVDRQGEWLGQLQQAAGAGLQAVMAVSATQSASGDVWLGLLRKHAHLHLYATGLSFTHRRAHLMPIGLPEASAGWLPQQARQAWGDAVRVPGSPAGDDTSVVVVRSAADVPEAWPGADPAWKHVTRMRVVADQHGREHADAAISALAKSTFAAIDWRPGQPAPAALWAALYAEAFPVMADSAQARQLVGECPGLPAVLVPDGVAPSLGEESIRLALADPRRDVPWLRLSWWRNRIAAHLDGNPRPPLVWVHIGALWPEHLANSIRQAGLWNRGARRVLVTQRQFSARAPRADEAGIVEFVAVEDLDPSAAWCDFQRSTMGASKESFRGGFWRYTTERLMALEAWAQKSGTEELLHLENDNMLYADARELRPMARAWGVQVWVGTFRMHRREAVTNFVFVVRKRGLSRLVGAVAHPTPPGHGAASKPASNEMQRVGAWLRNAPAGAVGVYPPGSQREGWPGKIDGAGFGQWIGGNDPRNPGVSAAQGFCNTWTYFPCQDLAFQWGEGGGDAGSLAFPQYDVISDAGRGETVVLLNLHVHNKGRTSTLLSDLPRWSRLSLDSIAETGRW